jgi:glycosyltransferase involved in cell wall biosynthesis
MTSESMLTAAASSSSANVETRGRDLPLVTVILTTRDRPRFLSIALACYQHQTYPNRELIVVDDGEEYPLDPAVVAAVGGRLIRVPVGTTLGAKLNLGAADARGSLCQNFDDDDWYAPRFLARMVTAVLSSWSVVCRPTVATLIPFLLFDLRRWQIRRSRDDGFAGSTLLFSPADARAAPFRDLSQAADSYFLEDQVHLGSTHLPVDALETFLAVRHGGGVMARGHTWTHLWGGGQPVDDDLTARPLYARGPEALLPGWALNAYREIRRELLGQASPIEASS